MEVLAIIPARSGSKSVKDKNIREINGKPMLAYSIEHGLKSEKINRVQVLLENGYLTIHAEKGLQEDDQEKKSGKYIRRERYSGACERSFYVGEDLEQEDIKGEFKHGILKLFVPKKEKNPQVEQKKYIMIE